MTHACQLLAELDCEAAAGDADAQALARWHAEHPDGPLSAEDAVVEAEVRRHYARTHSTAA